MPDHRAYFAHVQSLLSDIIDKEAHSLDAAVDMLSEATRRKNNIFIFGASHAGILSQEMAYRAGGLATVNPVFDSNLMLDQRPITYTSKMERLEGYGTLIAQKTPLKQGDVVIAHSVSGRNTVMIDFINKAKEQGVSVIAITNLTYSKQVDSRHPSGKRLFELADLVIDNHGDKGDAAIKFDGLTQKVGPTSTVIGASIVNALVVGVTNKLLEAGIDAPVLHSANVDGGDAHNQTIFKQYKANIFYL